MAALTLTCTSRHAPCGRKLEMARLLLFHCQRADPNLDVVQGSRDF